MTEIRRLPIPRCLLAEGPVWDARRNRLIVTDINGKRLHLLDWAAQRTHTLALPQKAGFAALCEDGLALGMEDGYVQELDSASPQYIPPFDLTGVE